MGNVKVVLQENNELLKERSARILHKYKNGKVLVELSEKAVQNKSSLEPIRTGVHLNSGPGEEAAAESELPVRNEDQENICLRYLEFIGPIDSSWLQEIVSRNIELLTYQPQNAYLARGKGKDFSEVKKLDFVEDVRPVPKRAKKSPVINEEGETTVFILCTGRKEHTETIVKEFNQLKGVRTSGPRPGMAGSYLRIKAHITAEGLAKLLAREEVMSIEEFVEAKSEDEVANLIICGQHTIQGLPEGKYTDWLDRHGLDGKGSCIAIVDQGVDTSHEAFKGRIKDLTDGKKHWHGTFVAGHAAGDYRQEKDALGFIYGIGLAPKADLLSISNSGVVSDPFSKSKLAILHEGPNGYKTYIQNNSWGAGLQDPMDYGSLEAAFDEMVRRADPDDPEAAPLIVCFSSGNSGSSGLTRPKAAKNVIVTGNSENFRRDVGGSDSDNIDDVYQNQDWQPSSHGNCGDGRIRPHLVAPGEWTASANFNAKPGDPEYISPKLTWGGGSSGASPKTAGACALIVQWWRQHNLGEKPSPAMVRALLVNSAKPMQSPCSRPPVPSRVQGWGRLCLDGIFETKHHHTYVDQSIALRNTGEEWSSEFIISKTDRPVKISLAWTDPPGNLNTGDRPENTAIINQLLLKVSVNGQEYVGNHFENGWSAPGRINGQRLPAMDNLQNVFLEVGTVDLSFKITVEALNITTNCHTFSPLDPAQDFALVVDNAHPYKNYTPSDILLLIDSGTQKDGGSSFYDGNKDEDTADYHSDPVEKDTPAVKGDEKEDSWWNDSFFSWEAENQLRENPLSETSKLKNWLMNGQDRLRFGLDEGDALLGLEETGSENDFRGSEGNAFERQVLKELGKLSGAAGLRQLSSVMVVSADSRFTSKSIDAIRKIAFHNELYFLSNSGAVLHYLALALKESVHIKYIFVENVQDMPEAIANFTYLSTGGSLNAIGKRRLQTGEAEVEAYQFRASKTDQKILMQIQFEGEKPEELMLQFPDENTKPFNIANYAGSHRRKGVQVKEYNNMFLVKINPEESQQELDGMVRVYSLQNREIRLTAWSWSLPEIAWRCESMDLSASNGVVHKQFFIELQGVNGAKLREMKVSIKKIPSGTELESEVVRREEVVKPRARKAYYEADNEEVESETERPLLLSGKLSHSFGYDFPSDRPLLQLLKIEYTGEDSNGIPFFKIMYKNIVEIPAKLILEQKKKQFTHYVSGEIKKLYYKSGELQAMRLSSQYGERDFRIHEGLLNNQVMRLLETGALLHYGIEKGEIVSIIQPTR